MKEVPMIKTMILMAFLALAACTNTMQGVEGDMQNNADAIGDAMKG